MFLIYGEYNNALNKKTLREEISKTMPIIYALIIICTLVSK